MGTGNEMLYVVSLPVFFGRLSTPGINLCELIGTPETDDMPSKAKLESATTWQAADELTGLHFYATTSLPVGFLWDSLIL